MVGARYKAVLLDKIPAVGDPRAPAKRVVVPFSTSSGVLVIENKKYDKLGRLGGAVG